MKDIKARDVFLAQDVLPESRRRKLISIQQVFDVSRERLRVLLDTLPSSGVTGIKLPKKPSKRALSSIQDPNQKDISQTSNAKSRARAESKTRTKRGATPTAEHAIAPIGASSVTPEKVQIPVAEERLVTKESQPIPVGDSPPILPYHDSQAIAAGPDSEATGEVFQSTAEFPSSREPATADVEQNKTTSHEDWAAPTLPRPEFIESVRPFVAMACEELAKAFVKVFGEDASMAAVGAVIGVKPQGPASTGQRREHRRNAVQGKGEAFPPSPPKATESVPLVADRDHDHFETDVQPLFDPKLPPDPNSPFKPRIALIAARTDDLVDLQQRFPQFELMAVTLDDLRGSSVLRTCQRIVVT